MWGEFKEVQPPSHRLYVRAYWRYLLGWGVRPPAPPFPNIITRRLRARAREEVDAYKKAAAKGAKVFYPYPKPNPDPNPPPEAA